MTQTVHHTDAIAWSPQIGPQAEACSLRYLVDELFYGGSRGSGKSAFLLGDFAADIEQGPAWSGILFRRSHPELEEIKRLALDMYPKLGGEYKVGSSTWHFSTGSVLRFRHIENVADASHYQGFSVTWLGFDELTNWADPMVYHKLKAIVRSSKGAIGQRVRATGNPGGVGDTWVKEYFGINHHPHGYYRIIDPESHLTRMFIPGRLQDNRILLDSDPEYVGRLRSSAGGDEMLLRAWLEGDWEASVGQFFNMWRREQVVVPPFEIPRGWTLFGSMDYGENNPTHFGIYAIDYDDVIYRVTEYHWADASATEHARNIADLIRTCPLTGGRSPDIILADPSMWVKRRLSEQWSKSPADIFAEHGVYLKPANNDRINGWRICRDVISRGKLKVFVGYNPEFLSSVPALPRSRTNPEDVDTNANDHAADSMRYGLVHFYKPAPPKNVPTPGSGQHLIDQLRKMAKAKAYR